MPNRPFSLSMPSDKITVPAGPGSFPGPARTHIRSNSFPDREKNLGRPLHYSASAETMLKKVFASG